MKKLLNYFLMLIVLLSFTACEMQIAQNHQNNNNVVLSFRSAAVKGMDLKVDVISDGIIIATETKYNLTGNEDFGKFSFDIPINETVTVNAYILDKGVIIYKGSKTSTVTKGSNPISIELTPIEMNVTVTSAIDQTILDNAKNSTYKVYVDGQPTDKSTTITSTTPISIALGKLKAGQKVKATIEKPDSGAPDSSSVITYYTTEEVPVISESINLKLEENKGRFLWNSTHAGTITYGISRADKNLETDNIFTINDVGYSDPYGSYATALQDYCFDENNKLWLLNFNQNQTSSISYTDLAYAYTPTNNPIIKDFSELDQTSKIADSLIFAISPFSNGILCVGREVINQDIPTSQNFYIGYIEKIQSQTNFKLEQVKLIGESFPKVKEELTNLGKYRTDEIHSMVVSGNDIYIGAISIEGNIDQSETQEPKSYMTIYKLHIDNSKSPKECTLIKKSTINEDFGIITDLAVQDNYLYATTFIGESNRSVGNLLKIDKNSLALVQKLGQFNGAFINYNDHPNYLIGPRKILAIKPKKLVIADDGGCLINDDPKAIGKSLKRVVTINLDKFVIEETLETMDIFDSSSISTESTFTFMPNTNFDLY